MNRRKLGIWIAAGIMAASGGVRAEPEGPPPGPPAGGAGMGPGPARWGARGDPGEMALSRMIKNPQRVKELGLTDAQIKQLEDGLFELQKQRIDLKRDMDLAALEQARLISAKQLDEKALMEAVQKTGDIQTEIAKLSVRQVVLLRKVLTDEQRAKFEQTMQRAARERMERAREMRPGDGRRGPPEGPRFHPPKEGERGERPPPPDREEAGPPPDLEPGPPPGE